MRHRTRAQALACVRNFAISLWRLNDLNAIKATLRVCGLASEVPGPRTGTPAATESALRTCSEAPFLPARAGKALAWAPSAAIPGYHPAAPRDFDVVVGGAPHLAQFQRPELDQ